MEQGSSKKTPQVTVPHETLVKFGYPDTCVKDYSHWAVCLRPKQVTLGSLVMIAKSDDTAFSKLSAPAFEEMQSVISDIEEALGQLTGYDKINYLTLMMVDPQVHSHVIPRYERSREFAGVMFEDTGWPGPPDIKHSAACPTEVFNKLLTEVKSLWKSG